MTSRKQGKSELKRNLPAKLLEPSLLQSKDEIKVKVLESCCGINFCLGFISCAAMRRTFQVKTPVNGVLRTEQIPHYDKSHLDHHHQMSTKFIIQMNIWIHLGFHMHVTTPPSSGQPQLISHSEDHKIWWLECSQRLEHDYSRLEASLKEPEICVHQLLDTNQHPKQCRILDSIKKLSTSTKNFGNHVGKVQIWQKNKLIWN